MSDDPRQKTAMVDVDGDVAPRLDTRILNKIPLLQGRDTSEFRSWQFVLKASLGFAGHCVFDRFATGRNSEIGDDAARQC